MTGSLESSMNDDWQPGVHNKCRLVAWSPEGRMTGSLESTKMMMGSLESRRKDDCLESIDVRQLIYDGY